jgi:hypothetical protein
MDQWVAMFHLRRQAHPLLSHLVGAESFHLDLNL